MANGMKSGSGEDPFDDIDVGDDSGDEDQTAGDTSNQEVTQSADTTSPSESTSPATSLPWKYARENVKSERDMVQFYLQAETKAIESQAEADLESMLDETVLTFDLREAAYRVALQEHIEDVADQLREWGYDAK